MNSRPSPWSLALWILGALLELFVAGPLARLLLRASPASLAEAVLRIGAPSVVAPMWDSDQHATATWTDAFMAAWHGNALPKALAARAAMAATYAEHGLERAGCIVLRGDWL